MNKITKIYMFPFLFFAVITSVVIFSWFRYGHLYGGGDVGLPSYDPARAFEITKNIWWEAAAPGTTVPHGLTSVPFQFVQSLLQNMGLSFVVIQATFFWVILFFMGYGMFLLGINVFGKSKYYLAILVALFYMFNPYMMIQVWHRFIHNSFFLAAALPFFFLFFRSWIKTGKYLYLLLFLLTNFLAVYLYGTIAFSVTIFTLVLFIFIIEILFPWKGFANLRSTLIRTFLGIIGWLAIHSWWLLPVLNVSPAVLSSQHSVVDNLSTLLSISWQTIIPYSLLGINPFYLYTQADFSKIYDTYFFRSLPWLSLIFLVPGFMRALKNIKWAPWALLAILGVFLAKGATSPFGYPYIFGFSNFFPLGVLRNPFEKMGIFIPFAYAILIPLGIEWYLENAKGKFKLISKLSISLLLILILIVNLWPMWAGKMFGKYNKLAFIQVPDSYLKVDKYIQNQKKTGRILHLPLTVSESVNYYYWNHGYSGVEPSQLLFKSLPSISRGLNIGLVDDALSALTYIFNIPNSEDKILSLLQAFSVKFIVLHKDIQWKGGYLSDPQKLETRLEKLNFLEKKIQIGDLIAYELKDEYFNEKIKLTNNISYYLATENNSYWPWMLSRNNEDILSPLNNNPEDIITKYPRQLSVSPEDAFVYNPQSVLKENLLGEMPAAKFLPGSPLYLLIKLKEYFLLSSLPTIDKFRFQLTIAGKRLTESLLIKDSKLQRSIIPQVKEYQQLLKNIKGGIQAYSRRVEEGKEISLNFIFSRHLFALDLIREKSNNQEKEVIDETLKELKNMLKETSTIPYNPLIKEESFSTAERLVSRFNLPMSGKYELLQTNENIQNIYPRSLSINTFQINDEVKNLRGIISSGFISYGFIDLPEGINEISFSPIPSQNLAKFSENLFEEDIQIKEQELEITSNKHNPRYIDIDINTVKGGNSYILNFESWIKLGEKFKIQVIQDTDPFNSEKPEETVPFYDNDFSRNNYENYWVSQNFDFYIKPATTKAIIRIMVEPWDGCKYFQVIKVICLNKQISYLYEKQAKVAFRNIQVVRLLTNPLFLRSSVLSSTLNESAGKVNVLQASPTSYSGKINLNLPAFFIFNETFHPGWELELWNEKKGIPSQKFLSNLYGNAWYIENPGEYNFKLEFKPQYNVGVGLIISGICGFIIISLTIRQKFRK